MILTTVILTAVLALVLVVLFTFFTRGTPVERIRLIGAGDEECAVGHPAFGEVFAILTNTTMSDGNRVEVLTNGDGVYPRLWADLESAESLITWHVFWFNPGQLADRLQEILIERARAGIEVLFLYDSFGSKAMPTEYFARLREAGVEVAAFRPPRWDTLYKVQQRMHVRAVVIDGSVGYTGGFAISDEWLGDGRHPGQWRDSSVRVEGRVVNQLQAAFASNWAEASCELLMGDRVFPHHAGAPPGDVTAGVMYAAPGLGSTNAERFFVLSVQGARERLYITNAYFVPDRHLREFLIDAVERGVDVRVLTPGPNTDRLSTYHAARHGYEELLEGGVRIWHYRPTMVHAKTIVVDGSWSAIGTINFDNRSMVLNDEVTLVMRDGGIAGLLERQFLEDLAHADEVTLEELRARGVVDRLKERFYATTSPFL